MKNISCRYLTIIQIIILVLLFSCKKDFNFDKTKDLNWNPDIALPLVNDSITFESAIPIFGTDKNFYIDEEGNVSLLYYFRNNAFRILACDLLVLPPFPFAFNHEITPVEQAILEIQDLIIPPVTFPLNLAEDNPDVIIDKLLVKEGSIIVNSDCSFDNEGYLIISIPNATVNGTPFSDTIRPFVSGNSNDTIDLSNVLFDLSSGPNSTSIQIDGLLTKSKELVAGDLMNSAFNVVIMKIGSFEGYLGQKTFPEIAESVRVTIFNNADVTGNMYFVEPSVSVTIVNSIGAPVENIITELKAFNSLSDSSLDIADRLGADSIINIESPVLGSNQSVIKMVDYTNDNTQNSMGDFFNIKPYHVFFNIHTRLNPNGQTMNFFSDTSSLYALLRVRLPLFGHFDNLSIQDTFSFTIASQEDIEFIEFKTHIVNGLPLQAKIQIYFVDYHYNILDSLTGSDVITIKEAPVDHSTFLPIPGMFGTVDTSYYFDPQKIKRIESVENMLVKAVLQSADGGQENVKIKAAQSLRLNFTARLHLKRNLEIGN